MKIIKLICSNCGAKLKIESDKKEYTCEYCNTINILDDEIIRVEHSFNDKQKEEKFKIANTYLEDFENYEEAYEAYERLSIEYPYEPKVWIQLIRAKTKKYQSIDEMDISDFILCDEYMKKYLTLEKNEKQKIKNEKEYETYKNKYLEIMKKLKEDEQIEQEKMEKNFKRAIIICLIIICSIILTFKIFEVVRDKINEKYKWEVDIYFNESKEDTYRRKSLSKDDLIVAHITTKGGRKDEKIQLGYIIKVNDEVVGSRQEFSFDWEDGTEGMVYFEAGDYPYDRGELTIKVFQIDGSTVSDLGSKTIRIK